MMSSKEILDPQMAPQFASHALPTAGVTAEGPLSDEFYHVPSTPPTPASHVVTCGNESGDEWAVSSLGLGESDLDSEHMSLQGVGGPALVMPRMPMEFIGKNSAHQVGKLKIMVAGRRATGKSQLLDALISESNIISNVTSAISVNGNPTLTERRAMAQEACEAEVLNDHNVAFVDIQGWEDDVADYVSTLTDYLASLYQETASLVNGLNPASIQILEQSSSLCQFPHVDACLYFVDEPVLRPEDIAVLRAVAPFVAIVPLIARSDELTPSEVLERKSSMVRQLKDLEISAALELYAVSSRLDFNWNMTASEVMSSGYRTHVLVESDLSVLIRDIFCCEGAKALRLNVANKFSEWVASMHLRSTLSHRMQQPVLVPRQMILDLGGRDLAKRGNMNVYETNCENYTHPNTVRPAIDDNGLWEDIEPQLNAEAKERHTARRRSSLSSIENIDPLDLRGWSRALKIVAALAAAMAAAAVGTLRLTWTQKGHTVETSAITSPTSNKWKELMEQWSMLLRLTIEA